MRKDAKFIYPLLIILVLFATSFESKPSTEAIYLGGWTKLGKHTVGEGVSYEELIFDEEKKDVKRLKVKVAKSSVYLLSIKVVYDDATSETHRVNRRLEKGDTTRDFHLIGHHRIIQKVMFVYRGDTSRGGAQLVVMGKM